MNTIVNAMRTTLAGSALALACLAPTAEAAIQNYMLTGTTESGPLAGQQYRASFSFDDALLGGVGEEWVSVTSFEAEVFGNSFAAAAMAETPTVNFLDGVLLGLNAVFDGGSPSFAFVGGFFEPGESYFAYDSALGAGFGSVAIAPIPEPDEATMLLAGLGLMVGVARRRIRSSRMALPSAA